MSVAFSRIIIAKKMSISAVNTMRQRIILCSEGLSSSVSDQRYQPSNLPIAQRMANDAITRQIRVMIRMRIEVVIG